MYHICIFSPQAHKGIKGFVKDKKDDPIVGAILSVEGHKKDIITASRGDYWRLLMPGQYKVTASAKGFAPVTRTVSVEPGPAKQLNFVLNRSGASEALASQDEPNPAEDSQPSPEEGPLPYQVQNAPQMSQMSVAGTGSNMMGGNMNSDNYGYGLGGGGYGGGFTETGGGNYGNGFGVLNGGFSNGFGINMMSGPEINPGGMQYAENKAPNSVNNNLELSGPLQDGALDRLAMMSPFETQSKDSENAPINVLTDDKNESNPFQ